MTRDEIRLGLQRIERWPRPDMEAAARLTPDEQNLLVEAAALLDITPVPADPLVRAGSFKERLR